MTAKDTEQLLLERYNTVSRRLTLRDARAKAWIYESFRRTVGSLLPPDRSASILDVACGEGSLLCFLRDRGYVNLSGFDLSPECVAICNELGLRFVHLFDARRLDELPGDSPFDVILALDVLEHVPKPEAARFVAGLRRRLRPGGCLVVQTPNMGSLLGLYHRHYDLSHEFGLTEKTAMDLMLLAGFAPADVEVRPAWNAATLLGRLREVYLAVLHRTVYLAEDSSRPRIPTKNLLIRAVRS